MASAKICAPRHTPRSRPKCTSRLPRKSAKWRAQKHRLEKTLKSAETLPKGEVTPKSLRSKMCPTRYGLLQFSKFQQPSLTMRQSKVASCASDTDFFLERGSSIDDGHAPSIEKPTFKNRKTTLCKPITGPCLDAPNGLALGIKQLVKAGRCW